jgi:uncharacterized protein YceH (UPF0502 family)
VEPDAIEIRVLGCLIEKQRTTPDAYPLSLNALTVACNQSTNRDPVVDYASGQVREALARLGPRRWTRNTSTSSSRTAKYRHMLDEALGLSPGELSVLAVLMLRGAQTPGELKQRTARMFEFPDLEAVDATLHALAERELVTALERRPGQKEVRWVQLVGGDTVDLPAAGPPVAAAVLPPPLVSAPVVVAPAPADPELRADVDALRDEVRELRAAIDALRAELGA